MRLPAIFAALVAAQALCAAFFLWDVVRDFSDPEGEGLHTGIELMTAIALWVAIFVEIWFVRAMIMRQRRMRRSVQVAAGALHDVIEAHFDDWRLTPAERDVALFLIKGNGITDIARLRGSAEGTVKSHLNAVYRKAGVSGRGALVSLFLDGLIEAAQDCGQGRDGDARPRRGSDHLTGDEPPSRPIPGGRENRP